MSIGTLKNILFASILVFSHSAFTEGRPFRFHLVEEPYTLDPAQTRGTSGSYVFINIYRGLYRYDRDKGLVPEQAQSCTRSHMTMTCVLKKGLKFSDGSEVAARHYEQAFKRLLHPETRTVRTELLLSLKNAKKILAGKLSPASLGIKALDERRLLFEFDEYDPEFEYKLTATSLVPLKTNVVPNREKASELASNGPYRIKKWEKGKKIVLEANPYSDHYSPKLPPVEIIFVEEHTTALKLYETGFLSFLRHLPVSFIPRYENRPDFHQIAMARFDYIGFGPALKDLPNLRKAMSLGLDYKAFQKMLDALGKPGCPSLPHRLQTKVHCFKFDSKGAQKILSKVDSDEKNKLRKLYFSRMGGDDISNSMEWIQHQWKVNLGLKIELQSTEQGMFLQKLRSHPPEIFRKGFNLARPTCLAALEKFLPGHRENYLNIKSQEFVNRVTALKMAKTPSEKKTACSNAIRWLIEGHKMIPLGEIHFTMLVKPQFTGWEINELNELNLSNLRYVSK